MAVTASIRAGRVNARSEALAIPCGVLRSAASPGSCGVRPAGSGASGLLMMPLPAGHLGRALALRFYCPSADMRHRAYSLRPRAGRRLYSYRRPESTEGARNARVSGALKFTQCAQTKMLGPTDLDASRHRGLSKSGPPSLLRASAGKPQVRRLPGVPRAVFEACSASPPVDFPFQVPALRKAAYPPLRAQTGPANL